MYVQPSAQSTQRPTSSDGLVTELMSHSKKSKPTTPPTSSLTKAKNVLKSLDPRNGLGAYLEKPETNPEERIVEYDDDFVVINDKYPKARYILSSTTQKPYVRSNTCPAYTSSSSPGTQPTTRNTRSSSSPPIRTSSPLSANTSPT